MSIIKLTNLIDFYYKAATSSEEERLDRQRERQRRYEKRKDPAKLKEQKKNDLMKIG